MEHADDRPTFELGPNVAMKIPESSYDATLAFYRDVLGLTLAPVDDELSPKVLRSCRIDSGPLTLWLDCVADEDAVGVWLELVTSDLPAAVRHVAAHRVLPEDWREPFPPGTDAHWVCNPLEIPHVLHGGAEAP